MTIENQSRTEKRTICIAVDESENSEFTVSWAIENIVQPESDTVVLLNARPSLAEFQPYVGPTPDYDALMKRIDADHIKKSTKLLNKLGLWFKAQNIETRGISLSGDPKAEILKKTTELNPSLLMVGSRGMGPIATGLLGSETLTDYEQKRKSRIESNRKMLESLGLQEPKQQSVPTTPRSSNNTFHFKLKNHCEQYYGWSSSKSDLLVDEFLNRFIPIIVYLNDYNGTICSAPALIVKVWHIALLYTKDYMNLREQFIHYNPDAEMDEVHKRKKRLSKTIEAYHQLFGIDNLDPTIWNCDSKALITSVKRKTPVSTRRITVKSASVTKTRYVDPSAVDWDSDPQLHYVPIKKEYTPTFKRQKPIETKEYGEFIQLYICPYVGEKYSVCVGKHETIGTLMQQLEKSHCIIPADYELKWNDVPLQWNSTIGSYGIPENENLKLDFKM